MAQSKLELIQINGIPGWMRIISFDMVPARCFAGEESKKNMNISSAIVHIVPARLDEACAALLGMPGVEIHARSPEGKVVVTLDEDDTEAAAERYVALHGIPGVASVAMVYQYCDDKSDTEEVEA